MTSRVLAVALGLAASSQGGELAWRSLLFQTNESSSGTALTSSWSFHLGYFAGGFLPTSSNTNQWCENWVTLDAAPYSEPQSRFVGVWDDDGSVPNNTKGYIWGFNRGAENPEWILLRSSDWTWPLPFSSPIDPNGGDEWLVEEANQVIVGQANQAGFHMKTAAVTGSPPLLTEEGWQSLVFTEAEQQDVLISGWGADPDGDGLNNLAEYAFGLEPMKKDQVAVEWEFSGSFFEFTVPKAEKVAATFLGEVSGDLVSWQQDSSSVVLVGETATSLTFRDLTPVSSGPRFGRVRAVLAD